MLEDLQIEVANDLPGSLNGRPRDGYSRRVRYRHLPSSM